MKTQPLPPTSIIILGATGDLAKRKLLPALYELIKGKKIKNFVILGGARSKTTAKAILTEAKKFIKKCDAQAWKKLEQRFYYYPLDFYKKEDYASFHKQLNTLEKKHKISGTRLFYLATLPQHFKAITKELKASKLATKKTGNWPRVAYEKPFGNDLKTALALNKCIRTIFTEKQVYRIDHYLAKELVENITLIRFTNRILEPLWNHKHIEYVQLLLTESIGVGHRGSFYDQYGALKDVVQNHALQLLALTAMNAPKKLTGENIRKEKVKVLNTIKVEDTLLGQYEGYRREKGVKKNSTTDTFAAVALTVNTPRWKGVPFYIKVGKALHQKQTSIRLKFKKVNCPLERCPTDSNYFIIRIEPDSGYSIELNSKVPGEKNRMVPVRMHFSEAARFGPNTPLAYETLLQDILKGKQDYFLRHDGIETSWNITEKIAKNKNTLHSYKKGSRGPKAFDTWSKKHKMHWHYYTKKLDKE